MSDFDVRGDRGTTIEFLITVLNPDASPVDLSLPGTTLTVTGKLTPDDAVPLFTKHYIQGNAGASQITISGVAHNIADVTIAPGDTAALTKTRYVLVDAVLIQPSGKETTVARGVIKVRAGIGT